MTILRSSIHSVFGFLIALVFAMQPTFLDAQNAKDLRNLGVEFLSQEKYWDALPKLQEYLEQKPEDQEARRLLAIAQSKTSDYEGATKSYQQIIASSRKIDPSLHFALAEAKHNTGDFRVAIQQYKKYLALEDNREAPQRQIAIANIKRCAIGLANLNRIDADAVVENMGAAVNSQFDDIIPVESPNVDTRVYFSSLRNTRFVDEFDDRGKLVAIKMYRDFDMFSTEIVNGAWSKAMPLNPALNTAGDEILQDFNSDGQVAIFTRGTDPSPSTVFVDTFDAAAMPNEGKVWQHSPDLKSAQLRGMHFFSDSVLVFSSDKHGGFGGYDIFVAFRQDDGWSIANLGAPINTHYDEIAPFLAYDGRTVFYSSNGVRSMGGFDIFSAEFDDQKQDWSSASNLGTPINSAVNDVFYRLSRDGGTAYFSSDRSGSEGGLDIYSTYYRTPRTVQAARSMPMLFTQVRDFRLFSETMVENDRTNDSPGASVEAEFRIPVLYFRGDNQIITSQNIPKLETIVRLAKTYPHAIFEIASHSDEYPTTNFDLYFSMKRAEEVASFLIEKGVKPASIITQGFGGTYPLARSIVNGKLNETGKWFNRRIDILVRNGNQLPIRMVSDLPEVSKALQDSAYVHFRKCTDTLHYRVHFATLDQMYKGDVTSDFPDPMIQKDANGSYNYSVGLHPSFADALAMLSDVKATGVTDAEIIPYLAGKKLTIGEISEEKLTAHPDLKEYLLFLN